MPRIRSIKPAAFRSLPLAGVPVGARWLFAGIWTEADDAGRVRDHPALLRSQLLPLDDLPLDAVEAWLQALVTAHAVCRYAAPNGERFLHVLGWLDSDEWGQVINRAKPSKLPACPACEPTPVAVPEQGTLPVLAVVSGIVNPRRCPEHQIGASVRCGACREARVAYEEAAKSRPTLSAKTVMCPDHPTQRAGLCPECAAASTTPPPEWRTAKH